MDSLYNTARIQPCEVAGVPRPAGDLGHILLGAFAGSVDDPRWAVAVGTAFAGYEAAKHQAGDTRVVGKMVEFAFGFALAKMIGGAW